MSNDGRYERGGTIGNTNVPIIANPVIRGSVRRNDPDGGHTQPWFASLAGTSLNLTVGVVGGSASSFTVNFTTNNYADAVAAVNAVSPSNFKWLESDGVAAIQNQHAGGKNYIEITGGTAAAVFGMAVFPAPGSYSQAGDIDSAPADKVQQNPQTTKLLSHDENLSTQGINRAILGAILSLDKRLNDLDREMVVYQNFVVTPYSSISAGTSDSVRLLNTSDYGSRLSYTAFIVAQAYKQVASVLTDVSVPLPLYDGSGNLVTLLHVSYGPSDTATPTAQTVTWGSPPSNPGANLAVQLIQSFKVPLINITSITGSTIVATGANFVTQGVQPHDTVTIQSPTNTLPFDHSGEYVVVQVIDNNTIVVRPMGDNEPMPHSTEDKPRGLNTFLGPGTNYGQIGVYVGHAIRMHGPNTGTITDGLFFKLSSALTVGSNYILKLPVTMSLREMLGSALLPSTDFSADPEIAYLNKLNIFAVLNTFSAGLSATGTSATVPAIDTPLNGGATPYTLLWKIDTGTNGNIRFYGSAATNLLITMNAVWGGATWSKDNTGQPAYVLYMGNSESGALLAGRSSGGGTWNDTYTGSGTGWDVKIAQFTTGISIISQILGLGDQLVSTAALARQQRLGGPTAGTTEGSALLMTLIEYWGPDANGAAARVYIGDAGQEYRITYNAFWDGTNWNCDTSSQASHAYQFGGLFKILSQPAGTNATPWLDSAWTSHIVAVDLTNSEVTLQSVSTSISLPLLVARDSAGNARGVLADHNGYPTQGNVSTFDEDWNIAIPTPVTTPGQLYGIPKWSFLNSGTGQISQYTAGSAYPSQAVILAGTTTLNSYATLQSVLPIATLSFSGLSFIMEWDANVHYTFSVNAFMGIDVTGSGDFSASTAYLRFALHGNGLHWIAEALGSGSQQSLDTGVTTSTSPLDPTTRFRIEYHGASSPYGQVTAKYFIDGQLKATFNTAGAPMPNAPGAACFQIKNPSTSGVPQLTIGTIRTKWNRFLNPTPVI